MTALEELHALADIQRAIEELRAARGTDKEDEKKLLVESKMSLFFDETIKVE